MTAVARTQKQVRWGARPVVWSVGGGFIALLAACPPYPCSEDMPIRAHVVDAQGKAVPITSLRATQEGTELSCHLLRLESGAAGVPADAPAENPFYFDCTPLGPGVVELELAAQGQTLRREVEVIEKKQREPACGTWLYNP